MIFKTILSLLSVGAAGVFLTSSCILLNPRHNKPICLESSFVIQERTKQNKISEGWGSISGNVVNVLFERPLSYGEVYIKGAEANYTTVDSLGFFSLQTFAGTHTLGVIGISNDTIFSDSIELLSQESIIIQVNFGCCYIE